MGTTVLLPLRRKAYWGFFRPKNPTALAGCEDANLGTKGQHATSRPPKPLNAETNYTIYGAIRVQSTFLREKIFSHFLIESSFLQFASSAHCNFLYAFPLSFHFLLHFEMHYDYRWFSHTTITFCARQCNVISRPSTFSDFLYVLNFVY